MRMQIISDFRLPIAFAHQHSHLIKKTQLRSEHRQQIDRVMMQCLQIAIQGERLLHLSGNDRVYHCEYIFFQRLWHHCHRDFLIDKITVKRQFI